MSNELQQRISFLEQELRLREAEITRYRAALAKSNSELEKIISDLGHELKMAAQIQKILSPTEIPNIPGFEFSTKFIAGSDRGGDYFDIFEHEDKLKFGIVLACSSGYSMSALFLSVLIKLSSQIEARKGLPADLVLAKMAAELVPNIENSDTASVFYGIIDRRGFDLTYSSNGSLVGFLLSRGTNQVTKLLPESGPFSRTYDEKPLAQTIPLGASDRLILVSEGVLNAANGRGESFGDSLLGSAILKTNKGSVHDMRNEILFQVEQFCGGTPPPRDETVIVIEVKERVIKLAKQGS